MQGEGSVARPFRETPFGRIVEVGWSVDGVVIVEVTAPEVKSYAVVSLDPEDAGTDFWSDPEAHEADYATHFMLLTSSTGSQGTVVVEDELTDIWIWDGFFTGVLGDEPFNSTQVAAGNAAFGYTAPLHLVGQQVKRNQLNPPFGTHDLGDVVSHTHPNGSTVRYRSGYTAISHGPTGEPPTGDVDFSGTESWYWYRVTTRPASEAAILRKSFLVNFRRDFMRRAELRDFPMALDYPLSWSISGYARGTGFAHADGRFTPLAGATPRFSASGSSPGPHEGAIRRFTGGSFVA